MLTEQPRRYGKWAGEPNGRPERLTDCREEVFPNERGAMHHQCNRKRGYGPHGWFCKQLVPDADRDERDVRVREGNRIVTAGHWAHGAELARWYQARGDFWNRCYELGLMTRVQTAKADKVPLWKRLEQIFAKREAPQS